MCCVLQSTGRTTDCEPGRKLEMLAPISYHKTEDTTTQEQFSQIPTGVAKHHNSTGKITQAKVTT